MPTPPALRSLALGDAPAAWAALGFSVVQGTCRIGDVTLDLTGAGGGFRGWTLAGEGTEGDVDGVPTRWTRAGPPAAPHPAHPNGVTRIDHVVLVTDALGRTLAALEAHGAEVRRVREAGGRRQAFLWLGGTILEAVEGGEGPARLWGLTVVSEDLDATARRLGDALGPVRPAVQPGRRIATLRREAGLGVPLALMTAHRA